MRIVIADDSALIRDGVARLLEDAGHEVVARIDNGDDLVDRVSELLPDAAIVDIRMPPSYTNEGLIAAERLRGRHAEMGVLVLSQHLDSRFALQLVEQHPGYIGYLLKDRVSDIAVLADCLRRVAEGECVIDPTIVSRLVEQGGLHGPIGSLTTREREVLALMAEGHSNRAIGAALFLSPKTVETHIGHILAKLDIDDAPDYHRRVLAVLRFLRST